MCRKNQKKPTEIKKSYKQNGVRFYETDVGKFTGEEISKLKGWKYSKLYNRYRTYGPGKLVLSDENLRGKVRNEGNAEWQALGTEPRA